MKKILGLATPFIMTFMLLAGISTSFVPAPAQAAGIFVGCNEEVINDDQGKFVAFKDPCDFGFLMMQINKFISFLLFDLAMPLAAIIFAYAGWLYMSSGGSGAQIEKAKGMFKNVLIGFLVALAAWLIVKAIMLGLGFNADSYDSFYK